MLLNEVCRYVEKTIKPTLLPEESAEFHAFTPVVVQVYTCCELRCGCDSEMKDDTE